MEEFDIVTSLATSLAGERQIRNSLTIAFACGSLVLTFANGMAPRRYANVRTGPLVTPTLYVPSFMADIRNENSTLTRFKPFLLAVEAGLLAGQAGLAGSFQDE